EDGDGQLAHLAQPGRDRPLREASVAHADRGRRTEALADASQGVGEPSHVMCAIPGHFAHRHPGGGPMPCRVARQLDVLKDRPRAWGAEGGIMPEAQELPELLHRGAWLQQTQVLQRLVRPRLQLCDLLGTVLHKPPPMCYSKLRYHPRAERGRTIAAATAYHARVITRRCACRPANLLGNYRMHHLVLP